MFKISFFTALCLAQLLVACGKNDSNSNHSLVQEIPTTDFQSAKDLAKSSAVSCADSASCNPSVGMLVATRPARLLSPAAVTTCTAFNVGPDLILTNSHCIPADLKNPLHYVNCEDRMKILYPSAGDLPGIEIPCDRIVSFSQSSEAILVDYALVRLKNSSGRPSLKISGDGISADQDFDLFKVNPIIQTQPTGLLTKTRCRAIQDSYTLPSFTSPFSIVASLSDCDAIPGNSGSPLVNEKGSASGIFQDIITPSKNPDVVKAIDKYLTDKDIATQVFATNLSCVSIPSVGAKANSSCDLTSSSAEESPLSLKELERSHPEEVAQEKAAEGNFQAWVKQNNRIFQWRSKIINESPLTHRALFSPYCFNKVSTWIDDYPKAWYEVFANHATQAKLEFPGGIPEFDTQLVFNRYLQAVARTNSFLSKSKIVIEFSPDSISSQNIGHIKIRENGTEILQDDIGECTN